MPSRFELPENDEPPQNFADELVNQFFPSGLFGDGRQCRLTRAVDGLTRSTHEDILAIGRESHAGFRDLLANRLTDPDERFRALPSTRALPPEDEDDRSEGVAEGQSLIWRFRRRLGL